MVGANQKERILRRNLSLEEVKRGAMVVVVGVGVVIPSVT